MKTNKTITVHSTINAPAGKVWSLWTEPEHIKRWNHANDDWHTVRAENDLRPGGKFSSRMEAKDGSMGFDFGGVYSEVRLHERLVYALDDGRRVTIDFKSDGGATGVTETFEPEAQNPADVQKGGWQAILDNFKKYAEG